ncbi:hypothetical protein ACH42_05380 [Endozoicomonas sp. (ex Bugula neritina AB1)]|nr:hypothetical protein ACH42_05380 [Endozoicomonas sp. (ex Bugula neritina AB1)]
MDGVNGNTQPQRSGSVDSTDSSAMDSSQSAGRSVATADVSRQQPSSDNLVNAHHTNTHDRAVTATTVASDEKFTVLAQPEDSSSDDEDDLSDDEVDLGGDELNMPQTIRIEEEQNSSPHHAASSTAAPNTAIMPSEPLAESLSSPESCQQEQVEWQETDYSNELMKLLDTPSQLRVRDKEGKLPIQKTAEKANSNNTMLSIMVYMISQHVSEVTEEYIEQRSKQNSRLPPPGTQTTVSVITDEQIKQWCQEFSHYPSFPDDLRLRQLVTCLSDPKDSSDALTTLRQFETFVFFTLRQVFWKMTPPYKDFRTLSRLLSNNIMAGFDGLACKAEQQYTRDTVLEEMSAFANRMSNLAIETTTPYNQDAHTCFLAIVKSYTLYQQSKAELQKKLDSNPLTRGLRSEALHHFFLDRRDNARTAPFLYENDFGNYAAMMQGFIKTMNLDSTTPITFSMVQTIHKTLFDTMMTRTGIPLTQYFPTPASKGTGYPFCALEKITLPAFQEICKQWKKGHFNFIANPRVGNKHQQEQTAQNIEKLRNIDLNNINLLRNLKGAIKNNSLRLEIVPEEPKRRAIAEQLINDFNQETGTAEDNHQTIKAIAKLCRNLELLHYFPDCNGRAQSILLLNGLLLRAGLPVCLSDSSLVFKHSVDELHDMILQWQKDAEQLKTH